MMINNERIDIVLDQISDLHSIVEGLKECGNSVPPFLIRMCDSKIDKVRSNLHALLGDIPELQPVVQSIEEAADISAKCEVEESPIEVDIAIVSESTAELESVQNEVEYVEEVTVEKVDDFDRFVENLVQQPSENEIGITDSVHSERVVIGEKFESKVLHEKIAISSNERTVEKLVATQIRVDLNKAISLNDKFLFQRELFYGNGGRMAETLNKLNQFTSLEECMKYLNKNVSWDDTNETARYFYSILEKRFNS